MVRGGWLVSVTRLSCYNNSAQILGISGKVNDEINHFLDTQTLGLFV